MERIISMDDVQRAVEKAYEDYKSDHKGQPSPRLKNADVKQFGIAVVLTDGRVAKKGDADAKFALGDIAKLPVSVMLAQQNTAREIVKKSGTCLKCNNNEDAARALHLPINVHGMLATSAIEPAGDRDAKYNMLLNTLSNMAGSMPVFNDDLYKELSKECADAKVVDSLARVQFQLYDGTEDVVEIYNKLRSLQMDAVQLATAGATLAADGVNPVNNAIVFDGAITATVMTLMTMVGNPRKRRAWMMKYGVPGLHSFSGAMIAVLPGFGAIVAYSPALGETSKLSHKAKHAIEEITGSLGLNIFASARVKVAQ